MILTSDGLLGLLREGYDFAGRRCARTGGDVFETRILGIPVTLLRGAEAAEVFYSDRFQRDGAVPSRVFKTLFGVGGVQSLDGAAHRHRKAMFMSLMGRESIGELIERTETQWRRSIERWERHDRPVTILDEAGWVICRAVCDWAGIDLPQSHVAARTAQFHLLIESPASLGPRYLAGRLARRNMDRWTRAAVEAVRSGEISPGPDTALHTVAWHRDMDGRLLDSHTAAVELVNFLRPTVVIDRYVAFLASALAEHPHWRDRLVHDDGAIEWFVQETRRLSPFFPFLGARAREDFDWNGTHFPAGRQVILDCYGTNRDPRSWRAPDRFDPERFADWQPDPFTLIPQGGGDHDTGHRCAGEWITIEQMKLATRVLCRWIDYRLPAQDLRVDHRKAPARPASGVVIADVVARSPDTGDTDGMAGAARKTALDAAGPAPRKTGSTRV